MRHRDNRLGDRYVIRIARNVFNERTVDLDMVDRKAFEITQGRIARAKIIQGDADAARLELAQHGCRAFRVIHHQTFGDFQFQLLRIDAGFIEHAHHRRV